MGQRTVNTLDATQSATVSKSRLIALVVFALTLPTLVTLVYFVWLKNYSPAIQQGSYAIGKSIQFLLPVAWVWYASRHRIGWRIKTNGLWIPILFGVIAAAAMLALYQWGLKGTDRFEGPAAAIQEKVSGMALDSVVRFAALGIFYSLVHSFLEEYYWRWFVFIELRKLCSLPVSILISSIGFMAHHVIVLAIYFGWTSFLTYFFSFSVGVGGAVWAYCYNRNGSLVGPWISHLLVDAAIFLIGFDIVRHSFG